MGIQGLTTFIDENSRLLKDFKLHDTKLIIDGNNVYHFLYYYFQTSHHFGGDYDSFADKCVLFFNLLSECGIRPFIVFDGAYDGSGKKLRTALKRATDRIASASLLSRGGRAKILPILAQETFVSVLKALDIPHITCNFEADSQIAALAVKWNCPVLTNDSDFFIYNMPAGVVLLDYMNLKVVEKSGYRCMNVQIFYVGNLMKEMNTDDSRIVALFATLLGNDIVDGRIFEPFFSRANMPRKHCNLQSVRSNAKFAKLVGWLHSVHDFSNALSIVLSYLREDRRDDVKALVLNSVKGYTNLDSELNDDFTDSTAATPVLSFGGNVLPRWYLDGIKRSEMPVRSLNAVTLRRVILLSQIEMMNEPSSYQCSLYLRQFIYAILLSVDDADGSESNKDGLRVREDDRDCKQLKCKSVEPLRSLGCDIQVPHLDRIPSLAVSDRQTLLLHVLNVKCDDLTNFPLEAQLLVGTIVFWVENAVSKVSTLHLEALLVCCVKLGILRSTLTEFSHSSNDDLMTLSEDVTAKLESFATKPQHNHAVRFDGNIIHAFSQFQSCLQSSIYANQLLLLPFPSIDPSRVFNGTFLYNFYRELRGRRDPELYVDELFGRNTLLAVAFGRLRNTVKSLISEGSWLDVAPLTVKNKKKKKTKGINNELNETELSEANGESELGKNESDLSAFRDINNKFSCLDIDGC